ncbi:hypothetical protein B0T26DRAFT_675816 [Lasiosphaeria miniovina]|uniref:Uncharacterized protein n=1 Tax=Lasiosphaeria miniovina TaxID=1954250 RepID=A0AA40AKM8_9PEZI|nr:uncharacterized protein B0T26DRAFT_675816 [Lasiosphaeria miniovina]KAK0717522.1 hypothetical protein B0T26DRAFT_675816 [Lasiosphaeria miniovina]
MLRNCSCTILLLPVVLLLQVTVLSSGIIFLLAGTGGIDNAEHLPRLSGVYFALNGDKYEADYCSPWGKQLFDQQWLWRVWGVDLVEKNYITSYPTLIVATENRVLIKLSTKPGLSHRDAPRRGRRAHLDEQAGRRHRQRIVGQPGGLAAAVALWALIAVREHRVRVRTGRSRMAARRDRRVGDGPSAFCVRGASYKHLSAGKDEMAGLHDHGYASHVDLVGVRARTPSPFEPMRHVNVG